MGHSQVQGAGAICTLSLSSADFFFNNPALLMHTHMMSYLCHTASPRHMGTIPSLFLSQPRCLEKLESSCHLSLTRQRSSPGPTDGLGWATRHRCSITGLGARRGQHARRRWLAKGSQFLLLGRGPEAVGTGLGEQQGCGVVGQRDGPVQPWVSASSPRGCRGCRAGWNWSLFGKSHHYQHMGSGLGERGLVPTSHLLSLSHPAHSRRRGGLTAMRELARAIPMARLEPPDLPLPRHPTGQPCSPPLG